MHARPGTIFPLRTKLVLSVERYARFASEFRGLHLLLSQELYQLGVVILRAHRSFENLGYVEVKISFIHSPHRFVPSSLSRFDVEGCQPPWV